MKAALNHAQTSHLAVLGSSTHCGGGPDEALGRVARGEAHVRLFVSRRKPAAAARAGLVATGSAHSISIVGDFGRITRRRWASVASSHLGPVGRRIAKLSRLPRCASYSSRALMRSGLKPSRVNASFPEPLGETHLNRPSTVIGRSDHDREGFANVRTAFQEGRNVFCG